MSPHKIYCSYINYYPDSSSLDSICIGLIFFDIESNDFLIDFSVQKIHRVNTMYGIKRSKLIKDYLRGLKTKKITFKQLQYLSDYENGSLRFSKPEKINVDNFTKDFEQLFNRYVNDFNKDSPLKRDEQHDRKLLRSYFRNNPFVSKKLNIGHTITKKEIGKLLFSNTEIDFIGGNGTLYCGQVIDLNSHISSLNSNVKNTLLLYLIFEDVFSKINLFDPKHCKIILTNLDSLDSEKEQLIKSLSKWEKEKGFDLIESESIDHVMLKIETELKSKDIMKYTDWLNQISPVT